MMCKRYMKRVMRLIVIEVAIEEERNRVDVAEVCVSEERYVDVCWRGKEIRLLKDEVKKILKR